MGFDLLQLSFYWPRLCLGGPRHGEFLPVNFTSVSPPGYQQATLFDMEGNVITEIQQHDSIRTDADLSEALARWNMTRSQS